MRDQQFGSGFFGDRGFGLTGFQGGEWREWRTSEAGIRGGRDGIRRGFGVV